MSHLNFANWRNLRCKRLLILGAQLSGVAFIAALFWTQATKLLMQGDIQLQLERNQYMMSRIEGLGVDSALLTEIKSQKLVLEQQLAMANSLRTNRFRVPWLLETLAKITPEAVSFTKLKKSGRVVEINGEFGASSDIAGLLDKVSEQREFENERVAKLSLMQNQPSSNNKRTATFRLQFDYVKPLSAKSDKGVR